MPFPAFLKIVVSSLLLGFESYKVFLFCFSFHGAYLNLNSDKIKDFTKTFFAVFAKSVSVKNGSLNHWSITIEDVC